MTQTLDAIYENGVFRPLREPKLAEGQSVQLIVAPRTTATDDPLELAGRVYDGLSQSQIDDIDHIARQRGDLFAV